MGGKKFATPSLKRGECKQKGNAGKKNFTWDTSNTLLPVFGNLLGGKHGHVQLKNKTFSRFVICRTHNGEDEN